MFRTFRTKHFYVFTVNRMMSSVTHLWNDPRAIFQFKGIAVFLHFYPFIQDISCITSLECLASNARVCDLLPSLKIFCCKKSTALISLACS